MLLNKDYKFWFCTGSQDLYGDECLAKVAQHSKQIVDELNKTGVLPYEIVWKPTLITNELIRKTFNEANNDETCAGVITWMHTFSPAKSWILGLQEYRKPLMHLHTQFNEELPYDSIDMDFMNENAGCLSVRLQPASCAATGMLCGGRFSKWNSQCIQCRM